MRDGNATISLKTVFLSLIALLPWLTAAPLHAIELNQYRYYKQAAGNNDTAANSLITINLDNEIYTATPDLQHHGIAVTDINKHPVPFKLEKLTWAGLTTHFEECPAKTLDASKDEEAQVIELENSEGTYVSRIELLAEPGDFSKNVDLFTSNDRRNWHPLASNLIILSYRLYYLKQTAISINANNSRYFKLRISTPVHEHFCPLKFIDDSASDLHHKLHNSPVTIKNAKLYRTLTLSKNLEYCTVPVSLDQIGTSNQKGYSEVTLQANGIPLQGFDIRLSNLEHFRVITVLGSNDNRNWHEILKKPYMNVNMPGYRHFNNIFNFPENRFQYYRIQYTVSPSEPPLPPATIKGLAAVYQLIIKGPQPRQLLVFFGGKSRDENSKTFKVDRLRNNTAVEYQLSQQLFNPQFGASANNSNMKIFLPFAIVALMIILIWYQRRRHAGHENRNQP